MEKKKFFPASLEKNVKMVALNFYLLPRNTSLTPWPNEELELLQAGMGRKTVSLPDDGDHTEVQFILSADVHVN